VSVSPAGAYQSPSLPLMDQTYSHEDIWLLLTIFKMIEEARSQNNRLWQIFKDLVQMETANAYPLGEDVASTATVLNSMADDLGSYKMLIDLWSMAEVNLMEEISQRAD